MPCLHVSAGAGLYSAMRGHTASRPRATTAEQARVRKSPVSRTAPMHVRESASSAAPTLKSTSDQAVYPGSFECRSLGGEESGSSAPQTQHWQRPHHRLGRVAFEPVQADKRPKNDAAVKRMSVAERLTRGASFCLVQVAPLDLPGLAPDVHFDEPASDHIQVPVGALAPHWRDDNLVPLGILDKN